MPTLTEVCEITYATYFHDEHWRIKRSVIHHDKGVLFRKFLCDYTVSPLASKLGCKSLCLAHKIIPIRTLRTSSRYYRPNTGLNRRHGWWIVIYATNRLWVDIQNEQQTGIVLGSRDSWGL